MRGRIVWAAAYVAGLNLAAWFSLETPAELLTWDHMVQVDKFQHLVTFLIATLVAIPLLGRWISAGILAIVLMNAGLVIEMLQAFDPSRNADVADFVFDQAGVALGWLLAIPFRRWLERMREAGSAPLRGG
ncbi:MAG: VanZ family protein [Thalassobaculum sp.]|uniref:VanZ family protein n=1 Tax=Thalassobaculum sp. TaxID=2022740 RepID=UPI0032EFD5D8